MIKYLFMFIIVDIVALTELFFAEIVYRYDIYFITLLIIEVLCL